MENKHGGERGVRKRERERERERERDFLRSEVTPGSKQLAIPDLDQLEKNVVDSVVRVTGQQD